jgi:hypothetical protein
VIIQVCASGGLKRESNSLAPALKLRRNQVALASHAVAGIDRQLQSPQTEPAPAAFLESCRGYSGVGRSHGVLTT